MKKRNWIFKIASALMMACLLTTCVISGTFAKFTSGYTSTATVTVAKWAFKLKDAALSENFAFDLFDTITDTDSSDADEDDQVAADVIAPGTKGSFKIELVNESEVFAKYTVSFSSESASNIPTNLKFSTDNANYVDFATFSTTKSEGELKYANNANDDQTTITVYWKWDFEGGATDDNNFAGNEITIKATIDLEQVD